MATLFGVSPVPDVIARSDQCGCEPTMHSTATARSASDSSSSLVTFHPDGPHERVPLGAVEEPYRHRVAALQQRGVQAVQSHGRLKIDNSADGCGRRADLSADLSGW